jgi:hypothetical protein
MPYSTSKLKTNAECDSAIALATERKSDLLFKQSALTRDLTGQEKSVETINAMLVAIKAQITGFTAAIETMSDGEAKRDLQSKLRRLNDQKENLEERLTKSGVASYLETELDSELSKKQVTEIEAFIDAINTRKGEL